MLHLCEMQIRSGHLRLLKGGDTKNILYTKTLKQVSPKSNPVNVLFYCVILYIHVLGRTVNVLFYCVNRYIHVVLCFCGVLETLAGTVYCEHGCAKIMYCLHVCVL